MRSEELRALGDLLAQAAGGIAGQARDVHAAVADRAFDAVAAAGVSVRPLRSAHDRIAAGSYAIAGGLAATLVRGAAEAGAVALSVRAPAARPLGTAPRGRVVLGALGGVWGDRLAADGSVLGTELALLVDDRRAPAARIAVFVHGLGETELSWRRSAGGYPSYGDRLTAELGVTPVYARFNSGLPIAESGAELSAALARLLAVWPGAAPELTLIGHSMGGLVIRAACHHGRAEPWCGRVRLTVCLGSPHEGAPLARAAQTAERLLGRLPETRPFAAPLRVRSAGIRDLERGSTLPFLPGAEHRFVSASVTRDPDTRAARALGDLLVLRHSAWARSSATERLRFGPDRYRHLGGATHFDLLGHPAVAEALVEWMAERRPTLSRGARTQLAAALVPGA